MNTNTTAPRLSRFRLAAAAGAVAGVVALGLGATSASAGSPPTIPPVIVNPTNPPIPTIPPIIVNPTDPGDPPIPTIPPVIVNPTFPDDTDPEPTDPADPGDPADPADPAAGGESGTPAAQPQAAPAGQLPETGATSGVLVLAGVALTAGGAAIVTMTRRRQTA